MSDLLARLAETGVTGLSAAEARRRLEAEGPNELPSPDRRGLVRIVREVLSEPMFLLLLAAGLLYLLLGDIGEAIVLLLFANLSIGIAVVQESRSERVLEALRELSTPGALVIRDGRRERIAGRDVARGDLLLLAEGDRVPADVVLVEGEGVEADESLLTGESVPVAKRVAGASDEAGVAPGGDDQPFLYSGTLVVRGSGRAVAIATGQQTEIGRIGRSLGAIVAEPPRLQAQTRRLVRVFGAAAIAMSALVVALAAVVRESFVEALLAGIAVGMSLLPEEFPLVLAVFMVMGAWRISQARVLTRRAAAIESLGAATVLCTDKTGTLTHNRMRIVHVQSWRRGAPSAGGGGDEEAARVLEAGVLASERDALDPMDRAFHDLARERGMDPGSLLGRFELLRAFGLRPDLPVMTMLHEDRASAGRRAVCKGAPEAVARLCGFSADERRALAREVDALAADGMRVLAVAGADVPRGEVPEGPEDLAFEPLGLVGFADPLREGVAEAVGECRRAGVRVVMITGDYPATARAIARDAGIDAGGVMTGAELSRLGTDELVARVREVGVFARILPEQKLHIVEALKAGGEVVAMTGDGVNDAPSLRAAHIGVAMGGRGTDVAREASSIVLLDDDFGAIVKTIRLGRRIYDNLRKAMGYVAALHVPIAGFAVLPLVLGMPLILTPMMIAFLEMIIDPVCSVVFEAEAEEADIMDRPPRDPQAHILPLRLLAWCAVQGTLALGLVAVVFGWAIRAGYSEQEIRSVVFAALVATNIALIFSNRSFGASSVDALTRPNRLVWWAIGGALSVLTAILSVPWLRELFRLGPMELPAVVLCGGAALLLFLALQVLKDLGKVRLAS